MSDALARFPVLVLLAVGMLGPAPAQSGPLIGYAHGQASASVARRTLCQSGRRLCTTPLLPSTPWSGAAAFNPLRDTVLFSDGLGIYDTDRACNPRCLFTYPLTLGAFSRVSGMAIDAARRRLFVLETVPSRAAVSTWSLSADDPCPVSRSNSCSPSSGLPSFGHYAMALAYDGRRDLLYVAASTLGPDPRNRLILSAAGDPACTTLCTIDVPQTACGGEQLGAIVGMAYDECRDLLYLADGRRTFVYLVQWPGGASCPNLGFRNCCAAALPDGEVWAGLDIEPNLPRFVGQSCLDDNCAICPNMLLNRSGLPVIGNPDFSYFVVDAPADAQGFVVVAAGGCRATRLPFLCGPIYPSLALTPLAIGPVTLNGSSTCDGRGSFGLPIPDDHQLCGVILCAQGIVFCPGTFGFGVTNALQATLGI